MSRFSIIKKIVILFTIYCLLTTAMGCRAFRRKFVRKKKRPEQPIEMILQPEEYVEVPEYSEETYREYFNFWKSWQGELINSLGEGANTKKQKECIAEAIKNLKKLSNLLMPEKRAILQTHIEDLINIQLRIEKANLSNDSMRNLRRRLETMKLRIDREFVYSRIKDHIIR